MVFYFTARDGCTIYMGKDKHENETLIKYGWPEDIWFHVDDLSSAHVYLRLPNIGSTWDELSDEALEDCCQLVKANSIQGSKKSSVKVVYTPWNNLLKTKDMVDGQVGYKNTRMVEYYTVERRDKELLKRLAKTKREDHPDLQKERAGRDREEIEKRKKERKKKLEEEKKLQEEREKERELKSYKTLFQSEAASYDGAAAASDDLFGGRVQATFDQTAAKEYEEDFM